MLRWFEKSVIEMRGEDNSEEAIVSIAQLSGLDMPSLSAPSSEAGFSFIGGVNSADADRFNLLTATGVETDTER